MQKPNIILIVLHDLGTHLACYGQENVQTPNIDRLAAGGIVFEKNFATATYCSPSRGAIITGKWPHANGLMGLVNLGWNLPPENLTLAQVLGGAGYDTHLFGVQHEAEDSAQLGFNHVVEGASFHCTDVVPHVVDFIAERAKKQKDRNAEPFYARVGFIEVHRLGFDYERYLDLPKAEANASVTTVPGFIKDSNLARTDVAQFNACVEHTDRYLGEIFDSVEEAGIGDNTIIVLTTDHGIDFPRAKGTLYDSGINTTLVMRWPAAIKAGRRCDHMVSNIDLFPTLCGAAGAETPDGVQGRSFLPVLGETQYEPNALVFAEKNTSTDDAKRCVRTDRWKYIRNFDEGPRLVLGTCTEYSLTRRGMGDEHLSPRPQAELYDLSSDPLELVNLAGKPEHAQQEAHLDATLSEWMRSTDDPLLEGPVARPPRESELRDAAWKKIREQSLNTRGD